MTKVAFKNISQADHDVKSGNNEPKSRLSRMASTIETCLRLVILDLSISANSSMNHRAMVMAAWGVVFFDARIALANL